MIELPRWRHHTPLPRFPGYSFFLTLLFEAQCWEPIGKKKRQEGEEKEEAGEEEEEEEEKEEEEEEVLKAKNWVSKIPGSLKTPRVWLRSRG